MVRTSPARRRGRSRSSGQWREPASGGRGRDARAVQAEDLRRRRQAGLDRGRGRPLRGLGAAGRHQRGQPRARLHGGLPQSGQRALAEPGVRAQPHGGGVKSEGADDEQGGHRPGATGREAHAHARSSWRVPIDQRLPDEEDERGPRARGTCPGAAGAATIGRGSPSGRARRSCPGSTRAGWSGACAPIRGTRPASRPASNPPARGLPRRACGDRRRRWPRTRGSRRPRPGADSQRPAIRQPSRQATTLASRPTAMPGKGDDVGQDLVVEVDQAEDEERGHERHVDEGAERGTVTQRDGEIEQAIRQLHRRVARRDPGAAVPAAAPQERGS